MDKVLAAKVIAAAIKAAFFEGFYDVETACNPMNTAEGAWEVSQAKKEHDKILYKSKGGLTT